MQANSKAKKLNQVFLLVLFFNLFLQFDFVEQFFSPDFTENQVVLANSPICDTQARIQNQETPKSSFEIFQAQALSLQLESQTQVSKHSASYYHFNDSPLKAPLKTPYIFGAHAPLISLSSGLSPPNA